MKALLLISVIVIPIITGFVIRIAVKKRPIAALVIWALLMIALLFFFIYGIILVSRQNTALFTKGHMANESVVISSLIFIVMGILYFIEHRKHFLRENNKS